MSPRNDVHLSSREMQMKSIVRCHYTAIRMTQLKINDNTDGDKDEEKLNHAYIAGRNVK